ncbi:MAG TPA: magnesium/cobalt transporter CorA [Acidimicrobiales bacterium]|nr:magnesium/cobalt transporter CorA [Acidimicrobiales bacterium]
MITVLSYGPQGSEVVHDPDEISDLVARGDRLLWVDLSDPTEDDFRTIDREFELHPLAVEDARKHGQRPKLELYPTHAFVVAYSRALCEVDLFIGPTWLVSVRGRNHAGETWSLDDARRRFERTSAPEFTVGFLLYSVLDELVDGWFVALDAVEEELEELEDRIFSHEPLVEAEVQQDLFHLRRRLLLARRAVMPVRDVLSALLRREVRWIDDATLVLLQDVYDHVLRVADAIDTQRELMGNAVDAHLAIISNRMNEVMKTMTSWGAILLGATLIAAIYGMNFEHMPELGWAYGYPFALGLMVVLTLVGWAFFRRRDWL